MTTTTEFRVTTASRTQLVPITHQIAKTIADNGWQNGVVTVFVPHTTAAVTINENADPDVARDIEMYTNEMVPHNSRFRHIEGNSDAHIKASLFGSSVQVIVKNGSIWLGTWQGIYFCEFDGPRDRKVYLAFTD